MNVLITGITGMVGSHLAEYILNTFPGVTVHGSVRWRSPLDNIKQIEGRVHLHQADLRDLNSLVLLLKKSRPDRIFHLAAQSYVDASFVAPADTLATNVIGTTNLLDAVRIVELDPLIHICSSSEVYGQVQQDETPIRETNPLRPASPYAVSKVGEDMIAFQYFRSYGVKTIRTRMFTHTGPRRGDVFAESAFAKQIAAIEAGIQENPLRVGNLNSVRTIADVRDAVKAYWLLLERCVPGEVYNIGGSKTMTVGTILEILKGLSTARIEHEVHPALLRPSDVTLQIPDVSRFQALTGWKTEISVEQTLSDLLDYHRGKIRAGNYDARPEPLRAMDATRRPAAGMRIQ
jgi:GDP-mannose 4,6-dehydratase